MYLHPVFVLLDFPNAFSSSSSVLVHGRSISYMCVCITPPLLSHSIDMFILIMKLAGK